MLPVLPDRASAPVQGLMVTSPCTRQRSVFHRWYVQPRMYNMRTPVGKTRIVIITSLKKKHNSNRNNKIE